MVDCIASRNIAQGIVLSDDAIVYRCSAGMVRTARDWVRCRRFPVYEGVGIMVGDNGTVQGCSANFNSFNNIQVSSGSLVARCTANQSEGAGINLGEESVALENVCRQNSTGIRAVGNGSRIEGNSVVANTDGIRIHSPLVNNLVIKNSAMGNSTNYSIPAPTLLAGRATTV
ncbi:MAG TPA: NosD domain-containing protein [Chthoniobacterales bacterium]|nr:NosD domain-containing protein [Chthoniobacterales bacterium]